MRSWRRGPAVALIGLTSVVASVSFAGGGLASAASKPAKQTPTLLPISVATSGATGNSSPLYTGFEIGIYKRYGLAMTVDPLTPTASVAAVLNGNVDIADDGPGMVAGIVAAGTAKVIFTNGVADFQLWAKSNITSISQLRGGTIGVTTPGGGIDTAARLGLVANHLIPGKDVSMAYLNTNGASLAGVENGKVTAAALSPPTTIQAREAGLHEILSLVKWSTGSVWAVNSSFAKHHRATVIRFIRAFCAVTNKAKHVESYSEAGLRDYAGITDQAQLAGVWQSYKGLWACAPYPSSQMRAVMRSITPPLNASPKDLTDNTFINAIGLNNQVVPPSVRPGTQ